jgi:hypothetical protein
MVTNMSPNTPPFASSLAALGWNGTPEQRDPLDRPSYVGPVSFSQLPWVEDVAEIRRRKADIAIIGSAAEVQDRVAALAGIGVTDFAAVEFGATPDEIANTRAALKGLLSSRG